MKDTFDGSKPFMGEGKETFDKIKTINVRQTWMEYYPQKRERFQDSTRHKRN